MIQWRKRISFDFHHIPKLCIGLNDVMNLSKHCRGLTVMFEIVKSYTDTFQKHWLEGSLQDNSLFFLFFSLFSCSSISFFFLCVYVLCSFCDYCWHCHHFNYVFFLFFQGADSDVWNHEKLRPHLPEALVEGSLQDRLQDIWQHEAPWADGWGRSGDVIMWYGHVILYD